MLASTGLDFEIRQHNFRVTVITTSPVAVSITLRTSAMSSAAATPAEPEEDFAQPGDAVRRLLHDHAEALGSKSGCSFS